MIRIAGIVNDSVVDGTGLRLTVFTQGCPHHCEGCHNPQTWDENGGYDEKLDKIIAKMKRNQILSGITISGGEPFMQVEPCTVLAKSAHEIGLNVWVYTGYTWEELLSKPEMWSLLIETDVLVDGRFDICQKTLNLPWRGSKNQRLIDVQKSLEKGEVVTWSRQV